MKKHIKTWSVVIALAATAAISGISIYLLGDYGLSVFLLAPLLIGFLPAFITGYYKKLKWKEAFGLGINTLLVALLGLLIFAMEGMVCIVMASPLLVLCVLTGASIAHAIHRNRHNPSPVVSVAILVMASVASLGFDEANDSPTLIPVTTSVTVQGPIEEVWENVVTFNQIPEPDDWFFETGISYPTHATIEGKGVGAVRYCNFTTGSFVEPITVWDKPNLLAFDVVEQPIPMNEHNPFWDIHPPHLDGYFASQKGQFKLTQLSENEILLEGTTWYKVDIHPEWYWQIWSDYIIHRIHERVLGHIKSEVEN